MKNSYHFAGRFGLKKFHSFSIQKKTGFVVLVIAVLLFGTVFVAFFGFSLSEKERDISWIDDVENFIEEVRPSEPIESWGMGFYGYYFTLSDNGEAELLYHVTDEGNTNDNFVLYMENLIYKANNVLNNSVDEEFIEEISQNTKFLTVNFGTYFGETAEQETSIFTSAWFILEDNINKNLKGTIILIQDTHPEGTSLHNWEKEITLREIVTQ